MSSSLYLLLVRRVDSIAPQLVFGHDHVTRLLGHSHCCLRRLGLVFLRTYAPVYIQAPPCPFWCPLFVHMFKLVKMAQGVVPYFNTLSACRTSSGVTIPHYMLALVPPMSVFLPFLAASHPYTSAHFCHHVYSR